MNHYEKLGTIAVRLVAVGFFVLTLLSLVFAIGVGTMGSMMGTGGQGMGSMMQGGMGMWWGPFLLNLVIGILLYAASRPLGRFVASGL